MSKNRYKLLAAIGIGIGILADNLFTGNGWLAAGSQPPSVAKATPAELAWQQNVGIPTANQFSHDVAVMVADFRSSGAAEGGRAYIDSYTIGTDVALDAESPLAPDHVINNDEVNMEFAAGVAANDITLWTGDTAQFLGDVGHFHQMLARFRGDMAAAAKEAAAR